MVTHEDIARAAGVSRSKVSRALGGDPRLVNAQEAERIRGIAEALGCFGRNRMARSIRTGRSGLLGCLIYDFTNPFYSELMVGIEGVAASNDCVIVYSDGSLSSNLVRRLMEYNLDGLILTGVPLSAGDQADLVHFIGAGGPVAHSVPLPAAGPLTFRVDADYCGAARAVTEHLLSLGHRRIAYSGDGTESEHIEGRFKGYADSMRARGLEPLQITSGAPGGGQECTFAAGLRVAELLMGMELPPTAVVAYNDVKALGLMRGLAAGGMGVPGQVSVCGLDGVAMGAMSSPVLTTSAVDIRGWGRQLAEALLLLVSTGRAASPEARRTSIPWTLRAGESVARVGGCE